RDNHLQSVRRIVLPQHAFETTDNALSFVASRNYDGDKREMVWAGHGVFLRLALPPMPVRFFTRPLTSRRRRGDGSVEGGTPLLQGEVCQHAVTRRLPHGRPKLQRAGDGAGNVLGVRRLGEDSG